LALELCFLLSWKIRAFKCLRHRRWSWPRSIASLRAPSILYLCLLERPSKICSNNTPILCCERCLSSRPHDPVLFSSLLVSLSPSVL
jgi:hypothetical protein